MILQKFVNCAKYIPSNNYSFSLKSINSKFYSCNPKFKKKQSSQNILVKNQYLKYTINLVKKMENISAVTYLPIPDKSENDKKLYKTILLPNGLKALLVSDPSPVPHDGLTSSSSSCDSTGDSCAEETSSEDDGSGITTSSEEDTDSDDDSEEGDEKLAACALLVDIGSFAEPRKYQGVAHFLEHMIFMGSEKYPLENAYDSHIKKCGGFDNANTECEETLFYFEVSEQHLDSSMDLFASLLKAPLMLKDAMTRERDSVESEFQQTLYEDEVRRDQLLASLASKDFPHNTFTWGNLKSLKENIDDNELHRVLHDFRKKYYSAQHMVVCLQARLPIDELETLVVKHFSGIPCNDIAKPDLTIFKYNKAFREEFYTKVFFVKPIENINKLEFTWVLPPMINNYRCKPDHFLSYLMGYEGEGSLCAYLRKKLWCLELLSGIDESGFDNNSMYSLFNICIYLTDRGMENIDEVIAATFAFIKLFKNVKCLKEAYDELAQIEKTGFRFASQKPAFDNVQELVVKTKYYPPKDILTGTELYFDYNEEQIQDIIKHLNEFRFNIMITSNKKVCKISTFDKKEKWFGTEYATVDMPKTWIDMWNNSKPMKELFMPFTNPFISSDFTILSNTNGQPDMYASPKKILQTNTCELWYRQDDKFNLPQAYMYFYFISPLIRQNAKNDVLCTLYCQLLKFCLVEELYPATVAGLEYQFFAADKGIVLKVNGYNEKLGLLVDIIVKGMKGLHEITNADQLDIFKVQQKKTYFNSLIKPKTVNKDIRLNIIESIRWPMITKYKMLDRISYDDMLQFINTFTNELYVQALIQGNLIEESAHNVMNSVLSTLNCQHIKETQYIENRCMELPLGSHYIRCNALNKKDINTFICNFYQIGPCTIRMESLLDLLMMFVEEPLFDTLRTKEQLGYYVAPTMRVNYGIAGYSIIINSQETKHTAGHVEDRIEVFRTKMIDILNDMSIDEYEHVRESLIRIKQVVDMSLQEEVVRNWGEITCEEYIFDRRRKEIEALRTITKEDIILFCLNNENNNLRKLSIQVIGNTQPDNGIENMDVDASEDGSDNDSDIDNELLFTELGDTLNLEFIARHGDPTTITNIDEFKNGLKMYPVTKTKIDSPIVNDNQNKIDLKIINNS